MNKYPCAICGGRGPHEGPGHAYTTDPLLAEADGLAVLESMQTHTTRDKVLATLRTQFKAKVLSIQLRGQPFAGMVDTVDPFAAGPMLEAFLGDLAANIAQVLDWNPNE
jgi:hypothetical protein